MTDNGRHNPPPPIRAFLLGQVRIRVGDRTISDDAWTLRSARSLMLVLLVTRGHAMPKERVLDILWPESSPDVARNALYKALHLLRRVLEPDLASARASVYIDTRGGTIGISPDVDVWVDVDACESKLGEAAIADPTTRRDRLRDAVSLYGGTLLPTDLYEDWPVARREAIQHAWEGAVLDLAAVDLDSGEPQASVPALELLLSINPALEAAHRALMRAYLATGQRDRALRQYKRCEAAVERELGLPPESETQALYDELLAAIPDRDLQPHAATGPFNNLPSPPTAIVGRDREIEILQGTLWRQDVRLLTLIGPGGVGKTRLAIEVAAHLAEDFADGVAFVPLAAVRDPALVVASISSALGLSEEQGVPLESTLKGYLRSREMLLVLDNFEQILDAGRHIADLLAHCGSLTVLVTSRERLHLRGEYLQEVAPLALPRPERLPAPAMLARYGAIAMFSQQMQQVDPTFQISTDNSEAISAICRHLDGLPLAIEIATARAHYIPLGSLLDKLTSRLDISEGPRDLPDRQRTLRATFAWSHDLLTPQEQAVFRRLGAAVGGYTPDAATAICGDDDSQLEHHLRSLAEKHLIRWEDTDNGYRIRLLETIRELAVEYLEASGELHKVSGRHAEYFLNLAVEAEEYLVGTDQLAWFERLEAEQGNIRSALDWSLSQQDDISEIAIRATVALWRYWLRRRSLTEGTTWLERALRLAPAQSSLRSRVLLSLARLHEAQSDYARAEALIGEALPICQETGDRSGEAQALTHLGGIAEDRGAFQRAASLHQQALTIFRANGLRRESAGSLNKLAIVAYYQGKFESAAKLWEESVAIYRELDDLWATGVLLGNLGAAAMATGDFDRAVELHEENLSIARLLKDPGTIGRQLCNLAEALQMRGDPHQDALLEEALALNRETNDRQCEASALTFMANSSFAHGDVRNAARLYGESLSLCQSIGDRATMANIALLERTALMALDCEHPRQAARLIGACERLRQKIGAPIMPYHRPLLDRCKTRLRSQIEPSALEALTAAGRSLSPDAAIEEGLVVCRLILTGGDAYSAREHEAVPAAPTLAITS